MQSNSERMAGCAATVSTEGGKRPIPKLRKKDDDADGDGDDDDDRRQRTSTATISSPDLPSWELSDSQGLDHDNGPHLATQVRELRGHRKHLPADAGPQRDSRQASATILVSRPFRLR